MFKRMAGHSKWANIKRRKGAVDAKRGKIFTKLVREVTTAARLGGGDPAGNPRLRAAIAAAKAQSMPSDNIDRAIKKGTGDMGEQAIEEVLYEGYGPGGVAILVEAQTDNRNRTAAEVRAVFSRAGGSLGASNSVAFMFDKQAQIAAEKGGRDEDALLEQMIEVGAQDVEFQDDMLLVTGNWRDFSALLDAVESLQLRVLDSQICMQPQNTVQVDPEKAAGLQEMLEKLEDLDDVQQVFSNAQF